MSRKSMASPVSSCIQHFTVCTRNTKMNVPKQSANTRTDMVVWNEPLGPDSPNSNPEPTAFQQRDPRKLYHHCATASSSGKW